MVIPVETKPALWGAVAGAVALAILGFKFGGWATAGQLEVIGAQRAKLAVATVFTTGNHGSILDPSGSEINAATTQEMQRQTANFLKSNGTCLPTGGSCSAE